MPLAPLKELPDRVGKTPAADAAHPGFPLFVDGTVGQRAYRPPHAVVDDKFAALRRKGDAPRGPTQLEKDNLPALDPTKPGAAYVDPCPAGAPVRTYRPHAIDAPYLCRDPSSSAGLRAVGRRLGLQGGAWARLAVRVVCARAPSLISVRGPAVRQGRRHDG
jgi:hypothetical protein